MNIIKVRKPNGQGIVEYAYCIAFISILICIAFTIAQGTLFAGVTGSYSSINSSLSQMNTASNPGGSTL